MAVTVLLVIDISSKDLFFEGPLLFSNLPLRYLNSWWWIHLFFQECTPKSRGEHWRQISPNNFHLSFIQEQNFFVGKLSLFFLASFVYKMLVVIVWFSTNGRQFDDPEKCISYVANS